MTDEEVKHNVTRKGQPKALYMLFMVEMWERFNYYGMRALLSLFMISTVIGFSKATSSKIYGMFTALVYLTPVLGGYLADRYIGKRHSITIGAILMALGQFTLASYELINPILALGTGLTLIIIGNGFFKPNISTIVGELYEPNDARRDGGFTIFYMGINVGAFFAPFICGFLGEPTDPMNALEAYKWKYGFMAAGVGMVIGLVWYLVSQNKYLGHIGLHPVTKNDQDEDPEEKAKAEAAKKPLTQDEWDKIKAIFTFVFFAIFFFAFFEQAGTSLNFFAKEATNLTPVLPLIGQITLKASYFQAVNPIFVVLLAPLFAKLWLKMGTKDPSIPSKFGWGLFLQGIGFTAIAIGAALYQANGPVSAIWLILVYLFCTMGELCLSPVGLSMVTKLAPLKFMSLFMGVWLTASFFGNLLAGWLASYYESWSLTTLFSVPAGLSLLFGVIMWIMTGKIKQWMHGVH
ncbi:MAG: peptide MFS transporter [Elusimicrobia bacterium]|nr:peptide MFS transporter [Elusimicrobiota bacterium]MDD7502563.1 peptide MFS transporter [Elusimicrobiota bacterium]MDY5729031.1 peptide MFS transporter [Elusimicrobiaceae bacterium]